MNYEDMQKFCDPDDVRLFCTRPFSDGNGHMIATDGKVVVSCVDTFEAEQFSVEQRTLDIFAKYLDPELFNGAFVPLQVEIPPYPKCSKCDGSGKVNKPATTECPDCDGEGEVFAGSHYCECKECDGTGLVADHSRTDVQTEDCGSCAGTGRAFHPIKLDDRTFQAKYLELIMALPNAEYLPDTYNHAIMRFRFDGGIGCLMPVMM